MNIKPVIQTRLILVLTTMLLILWVAPAAAPIVILGLSLFALRGPKESIQALMILFLLLFLNPGLFPFPDTVSTLRWLVIFAAFGRMIWDTVMNSASAPKGLLSPILLFSLVVLLLAVLVSYEPLISVLKITTFAMGATTILLCFHRTRYLAHYWVSWFVTLFLFVMTVSLPLYGSYLGYLKNGYSFQGILDHPQAYGPFAAPITALLMGLYLFQNSTSRIVQFGIILGWLAILTSDARTALLAVIGGFVFTVVYIAVLRRQWLPVLGQSLTRTSTFLALCLILAVTALKWDTLVGSTADFLLKGKAGMSITESLQDARLNAITKSMNNFENAPMTGIGFGVDSNLDNRRVSTGTFGIPTGAPVEKGLLFTAVLEETGVIGFLFFLWLLIAIIRPIWRGGSMPVFFLFMVGLLINMGEMVFFSIGGPAIYFWALVGLCYNLVEHVRIEASAQRRKSTEMPSPAYIYEQPVLQG